MAHNTAHTWQCRCESPEQTFAVAEALGASLRSPASLGLIGDLGAGKTLFVQGLAQALAVPSGVRVVSPTFTIINEYRGGRLPLFHVDLYRLDDESELDHIGVGDLWSDEAVVAVEWSDRFALLPTDALQISLEIASDTIRTLRVVSGGAASEQISATWRQLVGASRTGAGA